MRYVQRKALCSAQTTVFPLKMLVFTLEGVVCSGEFRIHNPKVGGSIPPPATNLPALFSKTSEKNRRQADVFWSNEPVRTLVLKRNGVLAPYKSTNAEGIPQTFKDPEGY